MTRDEALRLALEALEYSVSPGKKNPAIIAIIAIIAITAIEQVLGQQEPEIVAWDVYEHRVYGALGEKRHRVLWVEDYASGDLEKLLEAARNGGIDAQSKTISVKPLYTSPPKREWQGLTGDERDTIVRMAGDLLDAICLTESKLEEKNT